MAWRDGRTEKLWRSRLDAYALPKLGRIPVDSITPADVASVLLPVWSEKVETGHLGGSRLGVDGPGGADEDGPCPARAARHPGPPGARCGAGADNRRRR